MKLRLAFAFGALSALTFLAGPTVAGDFHSLAERAVAADAPSAAPAAPKPAPAHHQPVINNCDTCCDQGRGGCVAGVGFYYIKPYWKTNPSFLREREDVSGPINKDNNSQKDFGWDHEVAPIIWFGYTNCEGAGIRLRYWDFDHSVGLNGEIEGDTDNLVAASGGEDQGDIGINDDEDTLITASDLEITVYDLEVTHEFRPSCWSLLFSAGFRFVDLSQNYTAFGENIEDQDDNLANVDIFHRFKGAGLTAAIEANRPMGCGGLSLYSGTRVSLLYGTGYFRSRELEFDESDLLDEIDQNSVRWHDLMPVLELELGLEWKKETCSGCECFVRTGAVAQVWFGAGNASANGLLFAKDQPPDADVGEEVGPDLNSDLGLFGWTLQVGVRR